MISLFFVLLIYGHVAMAGPYTDSAHGNSSYGVNRTDTAGFGYARANCAHCHEQHASIGGSEPEPGGDAQAFCIFYKNFNTSKTLGPYSQSDDFCFYCHCYTDATTLQTTPNFTNYDYSHTFGGYNSSTPASIYAAFNQTSYHNLYDIQGFAETNFSSFFKSDSNPCVACHNPHLAKRNKENKSDPTYSAISKPSDHVSLWTNTMNDYAPSKYQAPYRYTSATCEPDGGGCVLVTQAQKTPDYVTFCQDCHSYDMSTYGLSYTPINWNIDKHGKADATGGIDINSPYSSTLGFVLSCTDCHEPHGAPNVMLIRNEVNGAVLTGTITTIASSSSSAPSPGPGDDNVELGYLCHRCHYGDNTKADNYYIHHTSSDAPYSPIMCKACHYDKSGPLDVTKICCNNCHFHGSTDSWAGIHATGRRTF